MSKSKIHNTDYKCEQKKLMDFIEGFHLEQEDEKNFVYRDQVLQLARHERNVIVIDVEHIRDYDDLELYEAIVKDTVRYSKILRNVIDNMIQDILENQQPIVDNTEGAAEKISIKYKKFEVYFTCGVTHSSVCEIKSSDIGHLVCVEATVILVTEVKPRVEVRTYTCDTCGAEAYQPVNNMWFTPPQNCLDKECVDGRLHLQGSKFTKFQELTILETTEQCPDGTIPISMKVFVFGEMTGRCSAGNLVQIAGAYLPTFDTGFVRTGGSSM